MIVSVLVTEVHTVESRAWLGQQEPGALVISDWVMAEVASALARKQRSGAISGPERARAQRVWSTAFAPRLTMLDIRPEDFARVELLVDAGEHGLRAADALHLAVAERSGCAMATLDDHLGGAARAIGLDVPAIHRAT